MIMGDLDEHLICPICRYIMLSPITIDDGTSYHRWCIRQWGGIKKESPVTRRPFKNKYSTLALNNLIYALIERGVMRITLVDISPREQMNQAAMKKFADAVKKEYAYDYFLEASTLGVPAFATRMIETRKLDLNQEDEDGNTPLLIACLRKQPEIVKAILDQGVDYNHQNKDGNTPLIIACINSDLTTISLLGEKPNLDYDKKNKEGLTAIRIVIRNSLAVTRRLILKHTTVDYETALEFLGIRVIRQNKKLGIKVCFL